MLENVEVGDKVYKRIFKKSYTENDNFSLDELTYVKLIHYNYNKEVLVRELYDNKV